MTSESGASPLRGRTALVTGSARRTGRAIAVALAREGAHCVLHHWTSSADVERTAAECRELGVEVETVRADLLDPDSVTELGRRAVDRGVDVLVHNASLFRRLPFFEASAEAQRDAFREDATIHLEAPLVLGRILGERLVARDWGRIVLVGDATAERTAVRNHPSYSVTKSGVPAVARMLALELGSRAPAVTVNAVLPGPVLPPEGDHGVGPDWIRRQTFSGEWLGPDAVARAVVFLAATETVTGETLRVDGGNAVRGV